MRDKYQITGIRYQTAMLCTRNGKIHFNLKMQLASIKVPNESLKRCRHKKLRHSVNTFPAQAKQSLQYWGCKAGLNGDLRVICLAQLSK